MSKATFVCILIMSSVLVADHAPVTRWIDPVGGRPITPKEFEEKFAMPSSPLQLGTVRQSRTLDNLIDVIIQTSLYESLDHEIDAFVFDLESEGFSVQLDTMSSGHPDELRYHLTMLMPNIVGAIFIGNLPVKWYRMEEDWGGGDTVIEIFPCDYYFFDLDGIWFDDDYDGLLDRHNTTTHNEADIWVGRLDPSRISFGDPVELLRNYFDRNHYYRTGAMPVWASALSYEYSDWHEYFYYEFNEFEYADIMRDIYLFNPTDYLQRTRGQAYELVSILCHSSPWRHYMDYGLVFNSDLSALPTHANFYQLFACSGARFVEQDNLGVCYLFMGDRALWSVGSTKTGSIAPECLPNFFQQLRTESVGEAMKYILTSFGDEIADWHYGLVILGDPTLRTVYESRGDIEIDSIYDAPVGNLISTSGTVSDLRVLKSTEDAYVYTLSNSEYWGTIQKHRYHSNNLTTIGDMTAYYSTTGELIISDDPENVYGAAEGTEIWIGRLDSDYPYYLYRGEGYHAHPFMLNTSRGACVVYEWLSPSTPTPENDLYITFESPSGWIPTGGYDFRITEDISEEIYPCIVEDSTGTIWIFWTALHPSGMQILCRTLDGTVLGEIESLSTGSMPTAIVTNDGNVWVFWRGTDGALWSSHNDGSWSAPEQIWNDYPILQPRAIADVNNKPFVLFTAQHSMQNTEIWALRKTGTGWRQIRLTNSNNPDFAPDGAIFSNEKLFLAWINGGSDGLSARWNVIDLLGIKENQSPVPQRLSINAYPTPFNDILNIEWGFGNRNVEILDLSGRIIARLYGNGSAHWDASVYPSNIYIVRIPGIGAKKVIHLQ